MKVQSLSVSVPCGCPNKCPFCVSKMRDIDEHCNMFNKKNINQRLLAETMIMTRMNFARDNDCNTIILTGTGEPTTNMNFLKDFGYWNKSLDKPFRWIELQTSGVNINDDSLIFLRDIVGVNTISLSCVDIAEDRINRNIMGLPESTYNMYSLCKKIKAAKLNLRISLNMTYVLNDFDIDDIFYRLEELGANQVTFRKLYTSTKIDKDKTEQDLWIEEHDCSDDKYVEIINYIKAYGRRLETLPFGAVRYSCENISTVIDDDCMATNEDNDTLKYLILDTDCHLYTKWNDKGSLLF